ncbi:MAG TPA: dihydroneopterin aldolase [Beijerinckiaceae bacterium]|nr:dihydroneopterin aldolase [Beijerinckiaceae bacterium]
MSDRIRVTRIGVYAYHGVHSEERSLGQRFFVSLDCRLDLGPAGRSDDVSKTADYSRMVEQVQEVAVARAFRTIEGLAEAVAAMCLADYPLLDSITVTVEKPGAPIAAMIDTVAVEITRSRHDAGNA